MTPLNSSIGARCRSKAQGKERKELYDFLSECFVDPDGDLHGIVGADEFEFLMETAALLPRQCGLAVSCVEFHGNMQMSVGKETKDRPNGQGLCWQN